MHLDTSSNPANTWIAFLAGAALGGLALALTTPKRGAELRQDLHRLGDKTKDQLGEWAESASEAVDEITAAGKARTDSTTRSSKAHGEALADKGRNAWKEIKKDTSSANNDVKDGLTAAAQELRT